MVCGYAPLARREEAHVTDWNAKVQETADRAEAEVRKLIEYMNDEVVPDVRKHSSIALRAAADRLRDLAQTLDQK